MSSQINDNTERPQAVASGPYETRRQAAADVAGIYDQARRTSRRDALSEANLAHLYLSLASHRLHRLGRTTHYQHPPHPRRTQPCTRVAFRTR